MMTFQFPFNPGDTLYQVISFSHEDCKIIEPIIIDEIIIDKTGVTYVSHEKERYFEGKSFRKELFDSQFEAFKELTKEFKLPVKIGDTLYSFDISNSIPITYPITINKIMKKADKFYLLTERGARHDLDNLNKRLFFSQEKAEATA